MRFAPPEAAPQSPHSRRPAPPSTAVLPHASDPNHDPDGRLQPRRVQPSARSCRLAGLACGARVCGQHTAAPLGPARVPAACEHGDAAMLIPCFVLPHTAVLHNSMHDLDMSRPYRHGIVVAVRDQSQSTEGIWPAHSRQRGLPHDSPRHVTCLPGAGEHLVSAPAQQPCGTARSAPGLAHSRNRPRA